MRLSPPTPQKVSVPAPSSFALRSVDEQATINRHNRLHPHYLIYLDDQGNVITDHTQVKQLLDLIRGQLPRRPRGDTGRLPLLQRRHPRRRRDGGLLRLLNTAIGSLIDVTEQRDIDSLFVGPKTTALQQGFRGLDDFELIAFLAIVKPEDSE